MAEFAHAYALLIAVNENETARFALPDVARDAEALQKVLTDPGLCGYLPDNVRPVMGQDASREGIKQGFAWLKDKLAADGDATAVVYYTGHGLKKPDDSFFFVPYDMGQADLTRLIPAEEFAAAVEDLQPQRLLVILDCCHAGGMGVKGAEEDGEAEELEGAAIPPPGKGGSPLSEGQGRAVLSSSSGTQKSFVRRDKAMSVFTYHLVEALNGHAQPEGGAAEVLVSDLIGYVTRKVSATSEAEFGLAQTPQNYLSGESFPVALVLGGKGLAAGEAAPKPEDLPVLQAIFNQAGQTVDTQINIGEMKDGQVFGKVGTVVTGGTVIFGAEAVNWDEFDYEPYLRRMQARFPEHMRRFAGAVEKEETRRYVDLLLQNDRYEEAAGEQRTELQRRVGVWSELVAYPAQILLVGDAGSGKTTQLLHETYVLAGKALNDPAAPIPFYLSLNAFRGGNIATLLEMLAHESGFPTQVVHGLWREAHRPVCLFVDGLDEVLSEHVDEAIGALQAWMQGARPEHSLVIACRPGLALDTIVRSGLRPRFEQLNFLPLSKESLRRLLEACGIRELDTFMDTGLEELLQTPDIVAAWVQALTGTIATELPKNMGQIYRLYVERHLFGDAAGEAHDAYSYRHVKRPILAWLAYTMLSNDRTSLVLTDELIADLVEQLSALEARFQRRRSVMPPDWSVQGLLNELNESPVLRRRVQFDDSILVSFTKSGYRDYYAAVYLAGLGADISAISERLRQIAPERSLQALLMLAGIMPETDADKAFDHLLAAEPALVTGLWFDSRPVGLAAPRFVRRNVEDHLAQLNAAVAGMAEPYTAEMLAGVLAHKRYQRSRRFQAAGTLTQWGLGGVELLLKAAADDLPLIRAVAHYALLHFGETTNGRPAPPLIETDGRSFQFVCDFGNGMVEIGPFRLLHAPDNVLRARLVVQCGHIDFDPFAVDVTFRFYHTLPAILAEDLFLAQQRVDWLGFLARCRWIAAHSLEMSRRIEAGRSAHTQLLVEEMQSRALSYLAMGKLLAQDVGLAGSFDALEKEAGWELPIREALEAFRRLRYYFGPANRARFAERPTIDTQIDVGDQPQTLRGGWRTNVYLDKVELGRAGRDDQAAQPPQLTSIEVVNQTQVVENAFLTGVSIGRVAADQATFPDKLRILATIQANRVADAALNGIRIGTLQGAVEHVKAHLVLQISQLERSRIHGVVTGDDFGEPLVLQQELQTQSDALLSALDGVGPGRKSDVETVRKRLEQIRGELSLPDSDLEMLEIGGRSLVRAGAKLADANPDIERLAAEVDKTIHRLINILPRPLEA